MDRKFEFVLIINVIIISRLKVQSDCSKMFNIGTKINADEDSW